MNPSGWAHRRRRERVQAALAFAGIVVVALIASIR
jgi:hypothetical protein